MSYDKKIPAWMPVLIASAAQAVFVMRYSVNVPFLDQFDNIPLLKHFSLSECFSLHNEHRLFFPRLLFFWAAKATGWNTGFEVFLNWAFLQVSAVLLFLILQKRFQPAQQWKAGLLTAFFLVPQYYENLLWGFQYCLQLSLMAALAAAYVLDSVRRPWLRVHAAALLCIIASFSFANGLISWIALLPVVIAGNEESRDFRSAMVREKWRAAYWAVVAACVYAMYFGDFHPRYPGDIQPAVSLASVPGVFCYAMSFLSAGFLGAGPGFFAAYPFVYVVSGAALCSVFILTLRRTLQSGDRDVVCWCLGVFVVFSAFITAVGRLQGGFHYAIVSRYREFSVLVPVMAAVLLMRNEGHKRGNIFYYGRIFVTGGMVLGACFGWRYAVLEGNGWFVRQTENRRILLSFERAGDEEMMRLYPFADVARTRAAELKKMGYSIFTGEPVNGG